MKEALLQNRPIALSLIATSLIISGLQAIFGTFVSLSTNRITINLWFLFLPAGIGLFCLSNGWRKFTVVCLAATALVLWGLLMYELIRPGQMPVNWGGKPTQGMERYFVFVPFVFVSCFVVGWAIYILTLPEIAKLFVSDSASKPEPSAPAEMTPPPA